MRVYTFEDLYRDHNVNALAADYARLGTSPADSSRGTPIEQWWRANGVAIVLRPLATYHERMDILGCSVCVERFAWMHFKAGWIQQKGVHR